MRSITWPRVVDISDRAIRKTIIGLGGKENGVVRESETVITVASEVMAVLALASDLADLRARLGRIVVAETTDGRPVTTEDLKVAGAMAALEELEETARLQLLAPVAPLNDEQIEELRRVFGAHW